MSRRWVVGRTVLVLAAALAGGGAGAQQRESASSPQPGSAGSARTPPVAAHGAGMLAGMPAPLSAPTAAGQDAFAAIAEVVRILDADPHTDWRQVDLERLRQHLIDMNEVVLRATVQAHLVPGGLAMEVTGTGRTGAAIRSMVIPHAAELDRMPGFTATAETIADGVRLTVTAREAGDGAAVARLRGLGFIGLLTLGAHHQRHHLALARGLAMPSGGH